MHPKRPATGTDHTTRPQVSPRRAMVAALALVTAFAGAAGVGSAQTTRAEGTWRPTRPMQVVRTDHTSTLLFGAKVLVAGGRNGSSTGAVPLSSAEVFDARTNLWTLTASMANVRWSHTATLLPDGRVLVAGGFQGAAGPNAQPVTDTAEIYDPATGTWTAVAPLNVRRALHSAALLPDGRVLVAGGRTCTQAPPAVCDFTVVTTTAEIFDPATGTWTLTANMNVPRHTTNAARLPDGRILVPNGFWGQGQPRQEGEWYDPSTGTWTLTEITDVTHARQGAIRLDNGQVVIAAGFTGGSIAEAFDPGTNTWNRVGNVIESARFNFFFSELPNGRGLIAGGQVPATGLSRSAEVYDPATQAWRSAGLMSTPHGSSSSLSNSYEAVLISSNPFTFEANRAVCGNLCGWVLVAGGNTAAVDLYIPACAGIPANITIQCSPY